MWLHLLLHFLTNKNNIKLLNTTTHVDVASLHLVASNHSYICQLGFVPLLFLGFLPSMSSLSRLCKNSTRFCNS